MEDTCNESVVAHFGTPARNLPVQTKITKKLRAAESQPATFRIPNFLHHQHYCLCHTVQLQTNKVPKCYQIGNAAQCFMFRPATSHGH